MRLSQLLGKRIINIYDGEIMGLVGDSDLVVNPETGAIESIIMPCRSERNFSEKMWLRGDKRVLNIPWEKVCKIGTEVIVVDIDYT
jgi:YlmC/YmxH family sporulation protein